MLDDSLKNAVIRTIAYAQVFQDSPSQFDVWRRLHWPRRVSKQELAAFSEFRQLPARRPVSATRTRKQREIARAVSVFSHIPWIRTVWLTGAVAAGMVKDEDDLDFLFVTDPNTLWLARFWVIVWGVLNGKYRSRWLGRRSTRDQWCCNIWLEPSALALPPERRTLYEARELVQAVPVYVRPGERASLLLERNRWARRFSANGFDLSLRRARRLMPIAGFLPIGRGTLGERSLNAILRQLQQLLTRRRISRETVLPQATFFHPRDTRSWVRSRYETICSAQGILPWFNEPAPWPNIPSRPTGRRKKLSAG